jgi:regulator of nucleoside diphosphate kinase
VIFLSKTSLQLETLGTFVRFVEKVKNNITMRSLIVNRLDYGRIKNYIEQARQLRSINAAESEKLLSELESAQIMEPQDIPSDVVTMNSIVKVSFLNNNKEVQFQIVYPDQAKFKEQKISIFSPIATALIGYKVGDEVEWVVPGGLTKLRIDQIIYQPEAAGDYQL